MVHFFKVVMPKEFKYFLSVCAGFLFGLAMSVFFVWQDLTGLGLSFNADNISDTFRLQKIYTVSIILFPLLFGLLGLFYARILNKQKMILGQAKEIDRNKRFAAIVKLAEGIGHEFNNPLTIILGQVYLYRELNRPDCTEDDICYKRLTIIENEAKKLSGITEKFIALSKTSSFFNRKKTDLNLLADDISKLKSEEMRRANIDLTMKIENSDSFAVVDKKGVYEIVNELFDNAIYYTRDYPTPRIKVIVSLSDSSLFIRVCDNGEGVSGEIADQIFNPLFTTKKNNEGPGLGLFIALKIAEAMSGNLKYIPSPTGACFELTIPSQQ